MADQTSRLALADLLTAARTADGDDGLNEDARLRWADPSLDTLLRWSGDDLIAVAVRDQRHLTCQLLVHPAHRRRGLGSELLKLLIHQGPTQVWAFGDSAAAQGFAAHHGLVEQRRLLVLQREVAASGRDPDESIRRFRVETDAAGLLEVNAAAFDWHPEQRHFSRADLDARMAEDWFDSDGLLVSEDADGITGFHWTKPHADGRGEVYILATHPRAQGRGLGRRLLTAGLDHLVATGHPLVHLYVDGANNQAIGLYTADGFTVVHRDVLYGVPDSDGVDTTDDPR